MEYSSKTEKDLWIYVHVGFELNHRSVCYDKQCLLVLSCVEER